MNNLVTRLHLNKVLPMGNQILGTINLFTLKPIEFSNYNNFIILSTLFKKNSKAVMA